MRAENRHYEKKYKKKKHPASKCSNAKCIICHSDKVLKVPSRQQMRADDVIEFNKKELELSGKPIINFEDIVLRGDIVSPLSK